MRALVLSCSIVGVALLAACVPDLGLPAENHIQCSSPDDCPKGWNCSTALGKCVAADGTDQQAPGIEGEVVVDPPLARAGAVVRVGFRTTEPLGIPPAVAVVLGPSSEAPLSARTLGERDFVFAYEVAGDEGLEQAPLVFTLVDSSGNEARLESGFVTFDFEPPIVEGLAWHPPADVGVVPPTATVRLDATSSADVVEADAELVAIDGGGTEGAIARLPVIVGGAGLTTLVDLRGLDLDGAAEIRLEIVARDQAGNESPVAKSPALVIDGQPPTVSFEDGPEDPSLEISPTIAFSADEEVASFDCALDDVPIPSCESPLELAELSLGTHRLTVSAVDLAGNRGAPSTHEWRIERRWKSVASGQFFTCALATDHTLWCWGDARDGALGLGVSGAAAAFSEPQQVETPLRWRSIHAGRYPCGIAHDGTLWCWGGGDNALGVSLFPWDTAGKEEPAQVGTEDDWVMVRPAGKAACGIRGAGPAGSLWCWGELRGHDYGPTPSQVGDDTDWVHVAVGQDHACGIREEGGLHSAWCWGQGREGQLGVGPDASPPEVEPLRVVEAGWATVAVSANSSCGIKRDGTLWCWGARAQELALIPVVPHESCVESPQACPIQIDDRSNWTAVSLGPTDGCAVADQRVYCWGDNQTGIADSAAPGVAQGLAPRGSLDSAAQVSVGWDHACSVELDQSLHCWGSDHLGQLGRGGDVLSTDQAVQVGEELDWVAVTTGRLHTCGIRETRGFRTLWCWGNNASGQLGDGTVVSRSTPVQIPGDDWLAVDAGDDHTCGTRGVSGAATAWCWGANGSGQAEEEPSVSARVVSPSQVGTSTGWTDVVALGEAHSCMVWRTGGQDQLWCWGSNAQRQLGFDTATDAYQGSSSFTPVRTRVGAATDWIALAAGSRHTCGLRSGGGGTAYCWGENNAEQSGVDAGVQSVSVVGIPTIIDDANGTPMSGWSAISAGDAHSCGVIGDTGYCWGWPGPLSTVLQPTVDYVTSRVDVPVDLGPSVLRRVLAGYDHTCTVDGADYVNCFGYGPLGRTHFQAPTHAADTHSSHACVIAADGSLWCWGEHRAGALGALDLWKVPAPVLLPAK